MKVRDQTIQYFEFIARIDEYLCPSTLRFQMSILICCRFYRSAACRSDADNTVSRLFCTIDLLSRFFIDHEEFRMHMMLGNLIHFYRTECSKPHMKCNSRNIHTFCLNLFQKFRCKMQSCRRCCCRTCVSCIYRLVTVLILQLVCDIWRQRHLAKLV